MSNNGSPEVDLKSNNDATQPRRASQHTRSIFDIPPPLKRIFDRFPLVTYNENERPLRAPPAAQTEHLLHVFASKEGARDGRPSYNPGCLKWQAYLRFSNISFRLVSATNHASPSGVLPFLLRAPSTNDTSATLDAVPSNKLRKWARSQSTSGTEEPEDMRYEAYASLIDNGLRKAWLYQLYINPANSGLACELYVAPCSSQPLVQMSIAHQLQQAAEAELAKFSFSGIISEADIFHETENAIEALATLLGYDDWFLGQTQPSLLDASVFAYTHLVLDENLHWGDNRLAEQLRKHQNLKSHREKIVERYF